MYLKCHTIPIDELLKQFMEEIKNESIEIYNECSLQHELGIFLKKFFTDFKIQFERNVKYFQINDTVKHEIDIVIFNNNYRYAIELKYPRNGQVPEQMYSFIKDICFMEQLKKKGFTNTYCLTVVENKNFYFGKKQDGIYSFFRGGNLISGIIRKPTGKKNAYITMEQEYSIHWSDSSSTSTTRKYYIVAI